MLNIGRNLAIDMLRSSAYKASSNNQSVDELVGIHEPEADTAVVPETIDVRDHVDRLPNDQRLIVELTYFRGLTQSEIADQFGIPLGTVKSRLRLAMNALRAIYAEVNS
jgi:RNA polymerase sigma-70 factor (ECF subfamily)